jgi:hypothetical protein
MEEEEDLLIELELFIRRGAAGGVPGLDRAAQIGARPRRAFAEHQERDVRE